MSTVDTAPTGRVRHAAGFTFLELMVCIALISTMAFVVQQTLKTTNNAQRYIEAVQRVTERGHNLTYEIREIITSSRRLFSDSVTGRDYWDALDLSVNPPVPSSRLPLFNEGGRLGPDKPGVPTTGNALLFVGETDATSVVSDAESGLKRHIDTYRFVAVYTHETDRRIVLLEEELALDLILWQSVEYPNYLQITEIDDDAERKTVVATLVGKYGHTLAWDPSGPVDGSFYSMSAAGEIDSLPLMQVTIEEHAIKSRGGRLVHANVQLARSQPQDARRKAVFTTEDPEDWRPNGFEVKVVGRSASRQVWMHLVTETQSVSGHSAAFPSTMIMALRDL